VKIFSFDLFYAVKKVLQLLGLLGSPGAPRS